jgi:hypothetical protein
LEHQLVKNSDKETLRSPSPTPTPPDVRPCSGLIIDLTDVPAKTEMIETAINTETAETSTISLEQVLEGAGTLTELINTETSQHHAFKSEDGSSTVSKDRKEESCGHETNTIIDEVQTQVKSIGEKSNLTPAPTEEDIKSEIKSEDKIEDIYPAKANINNLTLAPTEEDIKPEIKSEDKIEDIYPAKANIKPEIRDETKSKIESRSIEDMKTSAQRLLPFEAITENPPPSRQEKLQAMHSLLSIFYGRPPVISSNDIDLALRQSEHLIKAADVYGAVTLVRPHIGNIPSQFGRPLYHAIIREPRRWLNLSIQLQNAPFFREAMIHVVGTFPGKITTETLSGFSNRVRGLVESKVAEIRQKMSTVNEILFSAAIDYNGTRVRLDPYDKSCFDTWFITQMWRSWFCDKLAECRIPSRHPSEPNTMTKLGMLYRRIGAEYDAYLPVHRVQEILRNFTVPNSSEGTSCIPGFLQWHEAPLDLDLMKEYARQQVQEICKNESMLSPTEGKFQYLTCTSIANHELPWVVQLSN